MRQFKQAFIACITIAAATAVADNPLDKPGYWYESTDCSGDDTYLESLAEIPETANSWQYADESQCYKVEVVVVTGSPVSTPGWMWGVSSYIYDPIWNTGLGFAGPWMYVVRGDPPPPDEDGDGVPDADDKCPGTLGDSGFYGCKPKKYCLDIDTGYESKCLSWVSWATAKRELSSSAAGSYFDDLRDFANGGCDGDRYHWACKGIYGVENVMHNQSIWDVFVHNIRETLNKTMYPPSCPAYYVPQSIGPILGWSSFTMWSGLCVNLCQDTLMRAGVITSGAGATAAASTLAARIVLSQVGIGISIAAIACSGPYLVEGD